MQSIKYCSTLLFGLTLLQSQAGETPAAVSSKQTVAEIPPAAATFSDLYTKAKPTVDIRARYEYGEAEPLDDSNAFTVRGRLGLLSGTYAGFSLFAEYEGTLTADRDGYQAASVHGTGLGKTIIADPESHELNQAWVQ